MRREKNEESLGLGIYLEALRNRRKFIGIFVAAALVLSVAVSFVIPEKYEATSSILPPQQDAGPGLAMALSSGIGDLAGGLLGLQSTSDLWVGILKSATVKDAIIDRFRLREAYGEKTIEETRKKLDKAVAIEKSREDIVSITVEDGDPEKAAGMSNAFVEELDKVNRSVAMTSGGRARVFVEKRLNEVRADLAGAEEAIKKFQRENKALKLDEQSKALIEAYGNMKGSLMAREVELETFLSYATPQNARAQLLKAEIGELRKKLAELDEGGGGGRKDLLIPASRYPELSLKYAGLLREAKVRNTLFELLTQQFEVASIQEAKDSPTVQVLDMAKAPEKASKPNKPVIIIFGTVFSVFLSVFIALLLEFKDDLLQGLL